MIRDRRCSMGRQFVGLTGVLSLVFAIAAGSAVAFAVDAGASGPSASASTGVIAGRLGYEGGTCCKAFHPTGGLVKFKGTKKMPALKVMNAGRFRVDISPGNWTITGCGPGRPEVCGSPETVTVKVDTVTRVRLIWQMVP
jgi:hypothetical protein